MFAVPLSPPVARTHLHNRRVVYRGYQREDGLWDIEAELRDSKTGEFTVRGERTWQADEAIHGMAIRLTVDNQTVVQAIEVAMDDVPHPPCPEAAASMQRMVGCSLARGWRRAIEERLGGVEGCAHLRELLFNMATAGFQTMVHDVMPDDRPPPFLGKCKTWDFDGPTVERIFPMFYQRRHERVAQRPGDGERAA